MMTWSLNEYLELVKCGVKCFEHLYFYLFSPTGSLFDREIYYYWWPLEIVAEATCVQSTKIFDDHLNPVMLVIIRKLWLSTFR